MSLTSNSSGASSSALTYKNEKVFSSFIKLFLNPVSGGDNEDIEGVSLFIMQQVFSTQLSNVELLNLFYDKLLSVLDVIGENLEEEDLPAVFYAATSSNPILMDKLADEFQELKSLIKHGEELVTAGKDNIQSIYTHFLTRNIDPDEDPDSLKYQHGTLLEHPLMEALNTNTALAPYHRTITKFAKQAERVLIGAVNVPADTDNTDDRNYIIRNLWNNNFNMMLKALQLPNL